MKATTKKRRNLFIQQALKNNGYPPDIDDLFTKFDQHWETDREPIFRGILSHYRGLSEKLPRWLKN